MNWLRRLFNLDDAPVRRCLACSILEEQLRYEREQNRELIETLTSLVKPQPIVISDSKSEMTPIVPKYSRWSRKQAELERLDRMKAQTVATSPVVAKPDSEIDKLESDLGIESESEAS